MFKDDAKAAFAAVKAAANADRDAPSSQAEVNAKAAALNRALLALRCIPDKALLD